jgi:hypothetical protein
LFVFCFYFSPSSVCLFLLPFFVHHLLAYFISKQRNSQFQNIQLSIFFYQFFKNSAYRTECLDHVSVNKNVMRATRSLPYCVSRNSVTRHAASNASNSWEVNLGAGSCFIHWKQMTRQARFSGSLPLIQKPELALTQHVPCGVGASCWDKNSRNGEF